MDLPDAEMPISRVSIEEAAKRLPDLIGRVSRGERGGDRRRRAGGR